MDETPKLKHAVELRGIRNLPCVGSASSNEVFVRTWTRKNKRWHEAVLFEHLYLVPR